MHLEKTKNDKIITVPIIKVTRANDLKCGSGSTSIPAPDPLRFLFPDLDPLKKTLIWIRVAPKPFRVKSETKCFCYLRNAFSKLFAVTKISIVICPI